MRILVATDAWHPQVNGVVRTLTTMAAAAKSLGADFVLEGLNLDPLWKLCLAGILFGVPGGIGNLVAIYLTANFNSDRRLASRFTL